MTTPAATSTETTTLTKGKSEYGGDSRQEFLPGDKDNSSSQAKDTVVADEGNKSSSSEEESTPSSTPTPHKEGRQAGRRRERKNGRTEEKKNNQKVSGNTNARKRHGARNQHRHKFFVKWLMETFPFLEESGANVAHTPQDKPSLHILDVAGGKGEVSARLCMCHKQNVVMVDPRKANIVECYEKLVLPKIPKKWQQRIQEKISNNSNFVIDTVESRFQQLTTYFDENTISKSIDLQTAIRNSSLILGLHADSATEIIVDIALKYDKPFVIVPCCVFPNLFSKRYITVPEEDTSSSDGNGDASDDANIFGASEDGEKESVVVVGKLKQKFKKIPVRSHEQFIQYLSEKDPRFVIETLPFEGRNIAIWWDGK